MKDIQTGSILSETSFFVVKSVNKNDVTLTDDFGNELNISNDYVEKILSPADIFTSEEKKTMTELAELFINSPRIAMTVAFYKKDVPKTKTALKAEKEAMVTSFQNAKVSEIEGLVQRFIDNPITTVIPGELRIMKGRHYGEMDDLGRIQFVDMEIAKGSGATDARLRQVDTRSIQYLIVNKVKYILKK